MMQTFEPSYAVSTFDLNILPIHRINGQESDTLPGLLAVTPPRRTARGRERDSLILYSMLAGNATFLPPELMQLNSQAAGIFYQSSGSLTSAMRKAGIRQRLRDLEYEVIDEGNLDSDDPEALDVDDPRLRYLPEIAGVMEELARRVSKSLAAGETPLVLGGDHSIAIGTTLPKLPPRDAASSASSWTKTVSGTGSVRSIGAATLLGIVPQGTSRNGAARSTKRAP